MLRLYQVVHDDSTSGRQRHNRFGETSPSQRRTIAKSNSHQTVVIIIRSGNFIISVVLESLVASDFKLMPNMGQDLGSKFFAARSTHLVSPRHIRNSTNPSLHSTYCGMGSSMAAYGTAYGKSHCVKVDVGWYKIGWKKIVLIWLS